MNLLMRARQIAYRMATDEYIDLYILAGAALLFTVLGIFGVADVKALSSVILALLAVLALSQIRSRSHVADIAKSQHVEPLSLLQTDFPDDLVDKRAAASNLLLIGSSMARTVQAGARTHIRQILLSGAKVRVLLLDPMNDALVHAANKGISGDVGEDRLRRRIQSTLNELVDLLESAGGQLEIRVASFVPHMSFNVIDVDDPGGTIVVQHYEHRPVSEPAPIIRLRPTDGFWYAHFAAEAARMWEDGTPWPLTSAQILARSPRPQFQRSFGSELNGTMSEARDLLITGVTRNTLIISNYEELEEWLSNGCRIRLVLMDPTSETISDAANRCYAGRSPEGVRERIRYTLRLLAELRRSTGGNVSVRLTSHPLAMGLIAVDSTPSLRSASSAIFAEYYTYQARGEPKFVLQASDGEWFENFLGEAEALWRSAIEYRFDDTPLP